MRILRTPEMWEKYNQFMDASKDLTTCPLIQSWKYWVLVENEFPYDAITEKHHMLVPIRKFAESGEMKINEWLEFFNIKKELQNEYNCFLENTKKGRSVPTLYHLHLLSWKK